MGLLLLLSSMLLSSYFHPGRVVNAEQAFIIMSITLSIEPSADVTRDTNVTLTCKAAVSSSGQEAIHGKYTIYKDGDIIYTKTSSTSDELQYQLPMARVSNNGKYKCTINIKGEERSSDPKKLTVTGVSKPILQSNKSVVIEGEELTVRCTAPGETGPIFFFFKEGYKEIQEMKVNSNQAEAKLRFSKTGIHKIHCSYKVPINADSFKSVESDNITVSVEGLPINAALEIVPHYEVYEGDTLNTTCTTNGTVPRSKKVNFNLIQGTLLLGQDSIPVKSSKIAKAEEPGEFQCQLLIGNVVKTTTKTVSVTELFSVPTLTMFPPEVFHMEQITLTCKSESYASERIKKNDLTYTLDPPQTQLISRGNGVFSGSAPLNDFNYTCMAQAKGIMKHSETLTVRPKVSVSAPEISVVGRAVLEQPFKILCRSHTGSLPINYTLLKDGNPLRTISIKLSSQQALFTVTIRKTDEINKYTCMAKNSHKAPQFSKRLNTAVIEPLTNPILTVIPPSPEIFEGNRLYLICGTTGTPPVTFKWYLVGKEQPLFTTTIDTNNTDYQVPSLSKEDSGTYYCEAVNPANNVVRSNQVVVEVRMPMWKKAIIGGICLLVVSVVVCCVLYFKYKRGRETYSPPANPTSYV